MKALCLSLFSFLFASNAFAHGMSVADKAKALEQPKAHTHGDGKPHHH